ncbi:hypothetical protein ACG33_12315 [Steroidobacter denitrificans]|uniref:TonB-dependent receptor n=2 Tax=Steroidobacter denitrificans TaxID=465721 RepID=A0A127FDW4_STEDE|nr:hypothetical protein ACG33_12315 [Steroidobacter denitrificans]
MAGIVLGLSVGVAAQADTSAEPSMQDTASVPRIVRVEEIVVTGSRLKTDTLEGPSPVIVLDRGKIDSLGVSSVSELLRFTSQQPYVHSEVFAVNGSQVVSLRGLGADMTLVLINGRRVVPSAGVVAQNAFDLNTIPLAAVERVEVLSDAASAVYGADAVGGVVNIILKQDVSGTVADLHYGTAQGGARERRASLTTGWSGSRGHAVLVFDAFEKGALPGAERTRIRDQDFRRFGGENYRVPNTNPGNVRSLTGENLPGLPSPFAAVPQGGSGIGLTPADFQATAGERRMDSLLKYEAILPEAERYSVAAFAELEISPHAKLFAELLYNDRRSDLELSPARLSGAVVPAINPFNPFGIDVAVDYRFAGMSSRHIMSEAELWRGVGGARGWLGGWEWEVSLLNTQEEGSSWTRNALDPARVAQALAASDPAQALNVFADGPAGSAALLSSLMAVPTVSDYGSDGTQVAAFARGAALTLPAGAVQVVVGAEWREEEILSGDFIGHPVDRRASAVFAEVGLPLIDGAMQIPGVHGLSLQFAGRQDHYSDFGDTFNPQFGLMWTPVESLLLRISHGTSFRPPELLRLYSSRDTFPYVIVDPRRNGEVTEATAILAGNPDLDPVEGESSTVGFVFTPQGQPGLRLTGSYWRIKLKKRVEVFLPELVLANEARFPGRVVRDDPSPADAALGLPGRVLSVDMSDINFGLLDTRGIDFGVSHVFDTAAGQWSASLSATWVKKYETVDVPDTAPLDRVGVADVEGTIPEWSAVATLGWSRRGLSVSTSARYTDSYDDATYLGRLDRRVASQTLFDAQVTWDSDAYDMAGSRWLRGLKLTLGVSNLFDEEPRFSEIGSSFGFDSSQGDIRQRFGYINLSKKL